VTSRVPGLPVRGISQARLADLFDAPGCPLCRHAERSTARFLESMLWERVSDVGFQRELVEAGGFCGRHTRQVIVTDRRRMGGTLGSAILFGALLGARIRALDEARRHRGRTRVKRIAATRATPQCPACAQGEVAVSGAIDGFLEVAAEAAWANALGSAAFCVDHLGRLMVAGASSDAWRSIEDRQVARLRELHGRLADFVHHSSQDRRHLRTDDEERAADEATALLAGEDL